MEKLKGRKNIHLGAGPNIIKGWINYDTDTTWGAIKYDLTLGIPHPDNSVAKIYSEHFIEHLKKDDGYKMLSECFRVLKPGGAMRIGWPSFNKIINSGHTKSQRHKRHVTPHLKLRYGNWDEITIDRLFSWGHQYAYTPRYMKTILSDIGFVTVKRKKFGKSDYGFDYDTHNDPVTVYLEAIKPS